jgi:phosphoribosylanthranilate isomerase
VRVAPGTAVAPAPDQPAGAPAGPPPAKGPVRTRIKVCGITRLEDAEMAVEAGAWAIGLIFFRDSNRRCRITHAQQIGAALKRQVEIAGVFVNATLDEIDRTVDQVGLTLVQLHGDEGPAYCAEVSRRTGAKVIKAARVRTGADVAALRTFSTDFHLLDTYVPGVAGGTGESFDWELAAVRRAPAGEKQPPLILSGGLRPDNVAEAVREVRPYAVDVASGTEAAPGRKDPELVRAFVREVRGAFRYEDQAAGAPDGATATGTGASDAPSSGSTAEPGGSRTSATPTTETR